jgi:hypothetical protein
MATTLHVLNAAGDFIAVLVLIAGGTVLTALATLA